jgi:hypothetical protein
MSLDIWGRPCRKIGIDPPLQRIFYLRFADHIPDNPKTSKIKVSMKHPKNEPYMTINEP